MRERAIAISDTFEPLQDFVVAVGVFIDMLYYYDAVYGRAFREDIASLRKRWFEATNA